MNALINTLKWKNLMQHRYNRPKIFIGVKDYIIFINVKSCGNSVFFRFVFVFRHNPISVSIFKKMKLD